MVKHLMRTNIDSVHVASEMTTQQTSDELSFRLKCKLYVNRALSAWVSELYSNTN